MSVETVENDVGARLRACLAPKTSLDEMRERDVMFSRLLISEGQNKMGLIIFSMIFFVFVI